jgi:hypothetical protein
MKGWEREFSLVLILLLSVGLVGCMNSSTECLADAARDGHTRYQLGAISVDCKRKYPMVDGPWVPFGPKVEFHYEGQCYKVRVSDDFASESTYSQKYGLHRWLTRQGKKSKKEHRCHFSLVHFLTGSFFY